MGSEKLDRTLLTADGSHTWYSERFGQSYHSRHGALAESRRVFLELGFEAKLPGKLAVLEMGFGTGLNALLTWLEAEKKQIPVYYTTLEAYPIAPEEAAALNYDTVLGTDWLATLHGSVWGEDVVLSEFFTVRKEHTTLEEWLRSVGTAHLRFKSYAMEPTFDLIYFDAFGPRTQPELWTPEVFTALARMMPPDGVLTTYSSKGSVRRALQQAGFRVEKHRGPPGKLEVVRAIKG
ncbi:MAG: tRNA (5-methylaminomethyl-2-thiouridine)(34)-methyltransferase MnmD [Sphingobacteriaceae bacterium]|nr:tRNA (5-methylaminomethyl-2-thiouridine)(34)-methyltransferase MnmD [Cytophagaceae bacterium]